MKLGGPAVLGLAPAFVSNAPAAFPVEKTTTAGVESAYLRGEVSAREIVADYLARMADYDQRGLISSRSINLNPKAYEEADALDAKLKVTGKLYRPAPGSNPRGDANLITINFNGLRA